MLYTHNNTIHKQSIRTYMRSIRRMLTLQTQNIAAQLLTNKIMTIRYIYQSTHIAIFLPFDGEINTKLLINNLLLMKKKIYLPIIPLSDFQHLSFSRYTFATSLILNRFNIYEPQKNINSIVSIEKLDIIFIPLVAFDKYGNRLGMGKGFYDKTLKKHAEHQYTYKLIGLAYDFQKIPENLFPIEPWDIKIPEIITPHNHWHW